MWSGAGFNCGPSSLSAFVTLLAVKQVSLVGDAMKFECTGM